MGPEKTGMKKCPFCAEEIQAEAIRCRHCQADLTPKGVPAGSPWGALGGAVAIFAIIGGLWLLAQKSCDDTNKRSAQEKEARERAGLARFEAAKAKLEAKPPMILNDVSDAIGAEPSSCDPDKFTGEAICNWLFETKMITAYAAGDRKGSRINNIVYR